MKKNISSYIDYTNLYAYASQEDIIKLCDVAKKYDFFSVCVNPFYVQFAKQQLKGSKTKVCTVIGFPLGQNTTNIKVLETKDAIKNGAEEIDMVINIAMLQAKNSEYCINEINEVKKACSNKILKVIVETCYLSKEQLKLACEIVSKSNADFIKTSTGFGTGGAKLEDIKLMKKCMKNKKMIKASGGVKSYKEACEYIKNGVSRIGTSRILVEDTEDSNNSSSY